MSCPDFDLVDVDQLPPQMRELVRTIGLSETIALLEARGGIPTYIPRQPTGNSELNAFLSAESVAKLVAKWPGETLDIPMPTKLVTQLKNRAIIEATVNQGVPGRQAARQYGVTYRWVKILKRKAREDIDDGQRDLFDAG